LGPNLTYEIKIATFTICSALLRGRLSNLLTLVKTFYLRAPIKKKVNGFFVPRENCHDLEKN